LTWRAAASAVAPAFSTLLSVNGASAQAWRTQRAKLPLLFVLRANHLGRKGAGLADRMEEIAQHYHLTLSPDLRIPYMIYLDHHTHRHTDTHMLNGQRATQAIESTTPRNTSQYSLATYYPSTHPPTHARICSQKKTRKTQTQTFTEIRKLQR